MMRTVREIWDAMQEQAYAGNVGFAEMLQFMRTATEAQIKKMERLLETGKYEQAWQMLKRVTGSHLKGHMKDKDEG